MVMSGMNAMDNENLGLPPMELAEEKPKGSATRVSTNGLWIRKLQSMMSTTFFKIFFSVSLAVLMVVLIMKFSPKHENVSDTHKTHIIIVSESRPTNETKTDMNIYLEFNDKTTNKTMFRQNRKKRSSGKTKFVKRPTFPRTNINMLDIPKAREIVMNYNEKCDPKKRNEFCKNIMRKLNVAIIDENNKLRDETRRFRATYYNGNNNNEQTNHITQTFNSREDLINHHNPKTQSWVNSYHLNQDRLRKLHMSVKDRSDISVKDMSELSLRDKSHIVLAPRYYEPKDRLESQFSSGPPPQQGDCLMSRFMNQYSAPTSERNRAYENHLNPYFYSPYNSPRFPYSAPAFLNPPLYNGPTSYQEEGWASGRGDSKAEFEQNRHPQDIGINIQHIGASNVPHKSSSGYRFEPSQTFCPSNMGSCISEDLCIENDRWCDGAVDCIDASDETSCSCRSRVDKSRLCDGYYDCSFGEDEMGCFGCQKDQFSCDDVDLSSKSTCFLKSQRCDGVYDCPNRKDEIECNMLAPSLHEKPIYAVSHTEGFLLRNYKGKWYPVCDNPYMWAHDACRRETGLLMRPPYIQMEAIDPFFKGQYVDNTNGQVSQHYGGCYNNSALYVSCQDLLCGTRVMTTVQILQENSQAEMRMFGRLKRNIFLTQFPYKIITTPKITSIPNSSRTSLKSKRNKLSRVRRQLYVPLLPYLDRRSRKVESRVVGGVESQPGSWPWMVAIFCDGGFHCGGVVITNKWIVSAAHCVHGFWDHYYEVQVGMLRRFSFSPQEQNHKVTHILVNRGYSRAEMSNDISLLRVSPTIQFSRWVRPICLPSPSSAGSDWLWGPAPGTLCMAVGWGATVEHGPDPDHMREVEVPILEMCKHRSDLAGNEICAGYAEGGKDACQGDSGGPLLCKNPINSKQWYMAGIVSHGDGCGREGEPGVYTRVSLFVEWIHYNLASKILPTLRPKQDCPGFRCVSGITKCLPMKRKCDKIVDCLDGEDEIECNFVRSSEASDETSLLTSSLDIINNTNVKMNEFGKIITDDLYKSNETKKIHHKSMKSSFIEDTDDLLKQSDLNNNNSSKSVEQNKTDEEANITLVEKNILNKINYETKAVPKSKPNFKTDSNDPTNDFLKPKNNQIDSFASQEMNTFEPIIASNETEFDNISDSKQISNEIKKTNAFKNFSESMTTEKVTTVKYIVNEYENGIKNVQQTNTTSSNQSADSKEYGNTITTPINYFSNEIDESKELTINSDQKSTAEPPTTKLLTTELSKNTVLPLITSTKKFNIPTSTESANITIITPYTTTNILNFAHVKKKLLRPSYYRCLRIPQTIPSALRCNHRADCEDGTDELDCTCVEYLSTYNENLLCDGFIDCFDGSDEFDCLTCEEGEFLCKWSRTCLPIQSVCDGESNCLDGEDEYDCNALTDGQMIMYDVESRPEVKIEGYLTTRYSGGSWHVMCEDDIDVEDQEEAASSVCHHLGFSGYSKYVIKHLQIHKIINRRARHHDSKTSNVRERIEFVYRTNANESDSNEAEKRIITNHTVLPISCVPDVEKTCMSLFVTCSPTLNAQILSNKLIPIKARSGPELMKVTNEISEHRTEYLWPWAAKILVEGQYRCTGVLVDLSWVLISQNCFWDTLINKDYVSVVLGCKRGLFPARGPFEQARQVDAKKDINDAQVTLLHLRAPANLTRLVKPMVFPSLSTQRGDSEVCVTVGQSASNHTVTVVLEEVHLDCGPKDKCFVRHSPAPTCHKNAYPGESWTGIISCMAATGEGWYPAASYVERGGECGFRDHFVAHSLTHIRTDIKDALFSQPTPSVVFSTPQCAGVRCPRGRCVPLQRVCDNVRDCEDESDENIAACEKKQSFCSLDRHDPECACNSGQLKCKNGLCISKELFGNGKDDCGDSSDEPAGAGCSEYLARVSPDRLCDGTLHCLDRSDEDPSYCKCFAKRNFRCHHSNTCVALDFVCDGSRDCPHGEDESSCLGLQAKEGEPYGTGEVIQCRFGVWHTKCFPNGNHTKSELEEICREAGFHSGHARQLRSSETPSINPNTNVVADEFTKLVLNENTTITLRNSDRPLARAVVDDKAKSCYPVYIECI